MKYNFDSDESQIRVPRACGRCPPRLARPRLRAARPGPPERPQADSAPGGAQPPRSPAWRLNPRRRRLRGPARPGPLRGPPTDGAPGGATPPRTRPPLPLQRPLRPANSPRPPGARF